MEIQPIPDHHPYNFLRCSNNKEIKFKHMTAECGKVWEREQERNKTIMRLEHYQQHRFKKYIFNMLIVSYKNILKQPAASASSNGRTSQNRKQSAACCLSSLNFPCSHVLLRLLSQPGLAAFS